MKLLDAVRNGYLDRTMKLYDAAFPENERKDWQLMLNKRREGVLTIEAIVSDDGDFLGEVVCLNARNILLIDYLAVAPECRGMGVGTEVLKLLAAMYPEKKLILEIESTFTPAGNSVQRTRRKDFYLRAGMTPEPWLIKLFDVEMEILTLGGSIGFDGFSPAYTVKNSEKTSYCLHKTCSVPLPTCQSNCRLTSPI